MEIDVKNIVGLVILTIFTIGWIIFEIKEQRNNKKQ